MDPESRPLTKEGKECCGTAECEPCDVPEFCRNAFFTGKLLTERDFTAEQRYFIDSRAYTHLALHGWGIACGLTLSPHPYCPHLRVIIEPGLAIDGCGREIWVRERVEWSLPLVAAQPPAVKDPCPPEPPNWSRGSVPRAPDGPYPPRQGSYDPPPSDPGPCGPGTDIYLSLCYAECESELVPAPFDECACNGVTKRPNRICESFYIDWSTSKPRDWPDDDAGCNDQDCEQLYANMRKACAVPTKPGCVPLAVIRGMEEGKAITPEMVDYRDRRELPSTRLLDLLTRCILNKLPTKTYTQVLDINWEHGLEYRCRQFSEAYVGDATSPAALAIRFTNPVRTDTLSPMSFQAVIVQHGKERKEGGFMEVAPATVWASPDRTVFYLKIDPGYARYCMGRGSFDVYVVLRCNVLVDDRGLAVDGNLLASLKMNDVIVGPPTGDGIPGGTFESWFRVVE